MARDWHAWHTEYDDPASSLSRRLVVVRSQVDAALRARSGPTQLVSMCSGDGRDVLPVLAQHDDVTSLLVELDQELADAARRHTTELRLDDVVVRTTDAGCTSAYEGHVPADVLLACGVFGNITDADLVRTVSALPGLLASRGVVVWTRGATAPLDPGSASGDPSDLVRGTFEAAGFEEVAFVRPDDASFRVGVHRLDREPLPYEPGIRLFEFV